MQNLMLSDLPHIEYDNKDYVTKEEADAAAKAAAERNARGLPRFVINKEATANIGKREIKRADVNGGSNEPYKMPKLDII